MVAKREDRRRVLGVGNRDAVEERTVDFVAVDCDVAGLGYVDDFLEEGFGEDGAGWVLGVAGRESSQYFCKRVSPWWTYFKTMSFVSGLINATSSSRSGIQPFASFDSQKSTVAPAY